MNGDMINEDVYDQRGETLNNMEVGLGLRGEGRILKGGGRGGGIGGRRFYWGLIVFMLCRFTVVLLCVFFIISKTGILSFYLKKADLSNTDLS